MAQYPKYFFQSTPIRSPSKLHRMFTGSIYEDDAVPNLFEPRGGPAVLINLDGFEKHVHLREYSRVHQIHRLQAGENYCACNWDACDFELGDVMVETVYFRRDKMRDGVMVYKEERRPAPPEKKKTILEMIEDVKAAIRKRG